MTDRPETERVDALATVLHDREVWHRGLHSFADCPGPEKFVESYRKEAAAILAALTEDGWSVEPRALRAELTWLQERVEESRQSYNETVAKYPNDPALRSLRWAIGHAVVAVEAAALRGGPDATD